MTVKSVKVQPPRANIIKHFTTVIYQRAKQAGVFVSARPFRPIVMFSSKARAYTFEHVSDFPYRVGSGLTLKH